MKICLPKTLVLALLASLFVFAFIVSPYWFLAQSPFARITILIATVILGTTWSSLSASELELRFNARDAAFFSVLLVGLFLLNYRPLTAAIPWRGDEEHHIRITLYFATQIPFEWIVAVFVLLALFWMAAWREAKWAMAITGSMLVVGTAVFLWKDGPFQGERPDWIFRYPLLNYWFYLLIPKTAGYLVGVHHEVLYRIIPLVSAALIAHTFQRELNHWQGIASMLWGLAVATIPLVFYYSSILYLELPAVFLMLVVCLCIQALLQADFENLKREPAWYALLLLGLIKETTIVFLICFLAGRVAYRWQAGMGKMSQDRLRFLKGEFAVLYSTLLPLLLYLVLRGALTESRGFRPDLAGLLNPSVYRAIGQSLLEQFGPFLILFVMGCVWLASRREYASLIFFLSVFFATLLVFTIDTGGEHAGYSRFNLMILPVILGCALAVSRKIAKRGRFVGILSVGAIVGLNLLLSPVHLDGTKAPFWGNYLIDTSEHYYPYPEALAWLRENHADERILFTGMDYQYYFEFYFEQLGWSPKYKFDQNLVSGDYHEDFVMYFDGPGWAPQRRIDSWMVSDAGWGESILLSRALERAEAGNFDVVLYHVLGKELPQLEPSDASRFSAAKVFQNQAHILIAYIRARSSIGYFRRAGD